MSIRLGRNNGTAMVLAMLAMLLTSVFAVALLLTTSSEAIIAANFRNEREGWYAAEAALERALGDLAALPGWRLLLDGSVQATFADGPPSGQRTLIDGSILDLDQILSTANCQKATWCSAADLIAVTSKRPWGSNNPVWQLYAYGPLSSLLPPGAINSVFYVTVMVADDPSETDGDPQRDGDRPENPGSGVLWLRAEAFGPREAHQAIEATVARADRGEPPARAAGPAGLRVLSWRGKIGHAFTS